MPTGSEINDYAQHAAHVMAAVYHAATRDGTVPALAREIIKDIRGTLHETYFGKGEHGGEPGAPLNPLYYDVVQGRNEHATALEAAQSAEPPATPGQIVAEDRQAAAGVHGPQAERGTVQTNIYGYAPATTPGLILGEDEHGVHGPPAGRGTQAAAPDKSYVEAAMARRDAPEGGDAGSEQGQRPEGQSAPEPQREELHRGGRER